MARAITPGKLLLRNVYRALHQTRTSCDSLVHLDASTLKDFDWWSYAIDNWNGAPITLRPIDVRVQLETDASSDGWGAVLD